MDYAYNDLGEAVCQYLYGYNDGDAMTIFLLVIVLGAVELLGIFANVFIIGVLIKAKFWMNSGKVFLFAMTNIDLLFLLTAAAFYWMDGLMYGVTGHVEWLTRLNDASTPFKHVLLLSVMFILISLADDTITRVGQPNNCTKWIATPWFAVIDTLVVIAFSVLVNLGRFQSATRKCKDSMTDEWTVEIDRSSDQYNDGAADISNIVFYLLSCVCLVIQLVHITFKAQSPTSPINQQTVAPANNTLTKSHVRLVQLLIALFLLCAVPMLINEVLMQFIHIKSAFMHSLVYNVKAVALAVNSSAKIIIHVMVNDDFKFRPQERSQNEGQEMAIN